MRTQVQKGPLTFIFSLLLLTGFTGLVYQVGWQKYMSYLIGSESRSSSLVIATFLIGLAAGNAYFGRRAQRESSRKKLILTYAACEALIGLYALFFPQIFDLISPFVWSLSFNSSLSSGLIQLLLAMLLVVPPTFLMGSTIPLLTKALPQSLAESSHFHAKIYGINTVGAFLGVILSVLVFIPLFGLSLSLIIAGLLNLISALLLCLLPLSGETLEQSESQQNYSVQSEISNRELLLVSFFTGLIIIATEVLSIRLFALAAGPTHLSYPLIVGLFILALAKGSLDLKKSDLQTLRQTLWGAVFTLALYFFTIPYWPYWFSNIRASLTNVESNYYVYYSACFLLLILIAFPAIYLLGRLLPLSYGLMKKTSGNYAKLVGTLYLVNTLGTLAGSLIPGHYLLYFFDIPAIFLSFGFLLVLYAVRVEVLLSKQVLRWALLASVFFMIGALRWDRTAHYFSPFNQSQRSDQNFKGVFHISNFLDGATPLFVNDGPNTTVVVLENQAQTSRSIIVNGKSDGSTSEPDLSTVTLLGSLGYASLPSKDTPRKAAVIGLGTGITPGLLATLKEIKSVETLEIAPMVIKAAPFFEEYNYSLLENPKTKIISQDAFSFFGPREKSYDLIVSEPSNPWLSGVENLYTETFYKLVASSLTPEGVFTQWLHTYYMNERILASIFENIMRTFKYVNLYTTSSGDIALVAGQSPMTLKEITDPAFTKALAKIGIPDSQALELLLAMNEVTMRYIALNNKTFSHDLHFPLLQHYSSRAFFERQSIHEMHTLIDPYTARTLAIHYPQRKETFLDLRTDDHVCQNLPGHHFCERLTRARKLYQNYQGPGAPLFKLRNYSILRKENYISFDPNFLSQSARELKAPDEYVRKLVRATIEEWMKENKASEAQLYLEEMEQEHPQALSKAWMNNAMKFIQERAGQNKQINSILFKKGQDLPPQGNKFNGN